MKYYNINARSVPGVFFGLMLCLSELTLANECPGPALGQNVEVKAEAVVAPKVIAASSALEKKAKKSGGKAVVVSQAPPLTDLQILELHGTRIIGDKLSEEEMRRSILDLSGRLIIDEKGCLDGRCSEDAKIRARNYLMARAEEYGAKAYVEEYFEAVSNGAKINGNIKWGPLDFKTADRSFVEGMISDGQYHAIAKLLTFGGFIRIKVKKKKLQIDNIEKMKLLDLGFLQSILAIIKANPTGNTGPLLPGFEKSWSEVSEAFNFKDKPVKLSVLKDQIESLIRRVKTGIEALKDADKPVPKRLVLANVIAEIPGTTRPNEILEIAVHYDTVPGAPGADDNGSGLATALEILRIFSINRPQRTIRVVFADLEERGRQGTIHHVNVIKNRGDNVIGAIVVDTIGYHPLREDASKPVFVLELGTPGMRGGDENFVPADLMARVAENQFNRYNRYVRMSTELDGALPGTTDLGSYFSGRIPSYLIAAPYEGDFINPGYHRPNDVIENINWLYFKSIARFVVENVAILTGTRATVEDLRGLTPGTIEYYTSEYLPANNGRNNRLTINDKGGPKKFHMTGSGSFFGSDNNDYDDN